MRAYHDCGFDGYIRPDHGRHLWGEGPGTVRPGYGLYNEDGGSGDERAPVAHQQLRHVGDLVRRTGTARGTLGEHVLVKVPPGPVELVQRQRRDHDAGSDVVEPRATRAPLHRLSHDPLLVAPLGHLVGVEGIPDVLRPKDLQARQLLRRRSSQQLILLGRQSGHPPPGLAGDGHAHAAGSDHLPDLLQQHGGPVQIHRQNRLHRSLTGRNARGVHHHGDVAVLLSLGDQSLDGLPAGQIHLHGDHIVARLIHDLRHGLGVFQPLVAHDDLHPIAHPPGDSHTDLPGAGP